MKKYLLYIILCLGSFFLMSHNASAANLSYNLNDYDWITSVNLGTQYCAYSYNTFGSSPSICILTENRTKSFGIKSYDLAHEKGDLAQFYVSIQSNIDGANTQGNFGLYTENFGAINDHFKIIEFREATKEETTPLFDFAQDCTQPINNSWYCSLDGFSDQSYYSRIYKVTVLWTDRGSHPVGFFALNQNTPIFSCKISDGRFTGEGAQCQIRMFGYTQWGYVGDSANKEQEEKANQAISDSESSSEENSSNAKTTNLIGALSGIFTTISSTSATNCNITGDLGAVDMGVLNLCQGKEHFNSLIEFIGFSCMFVVVFWASYHLVRRTLGLIDWARSN